MAITVWGTVKDGLVVPQEVLPEGARVQIVLAETVTEVPPELQAEFDAWARASDKALAEVERLALESSEDAKR